MSSLLGTCHVCGSCGELTFEHVPARSAFNAEPATVYTYDQWLSLVETGSGRYEDMQRGSGYHTLCDTCNNTRGGGWYVPHYEGWVRAGAEIVRNLPSPMPPGEPLITATLHGVKPAVFAKQMVMMLLALNRLEFGEEFPELREYVVVRDAIGLPSRFRLFLSLFNAEVARFAGLYAAMNFVEPTKPPMLVTDLLYPPFAYTMTIDESVPAPRLGEVTWFTALGVDDERDVELRLPLNVTIMPFDEKMPEGVRQ